MTPLQQAATALMDAMVQTDFTCRLGEQLDALEKTLSDEQAQAVEPTKISWKNLVLWYEAGANNWDNLRDIVTGMLFTPPAPPATGERAELVTNLRELIDLHAWAKVVTNMAADMLETDAQEIGGWKEDQKENLANQVALQEQINALEPQKVEVPTVDKEMLLAAWLQWCLDNCDDSPEYNFGTTATEHMNALLAGMPAPMPPTK